MNETITIIFYSPSLWVEWTIWEGSEAFRGYDTQVAISIGASRYARENNCYHSRGKYQYYLLLEAIIWDNMTAHPMKRIVKSHEGDTLGNREAFISYYI